MKHLLWILILIASPAQALTLDVPAYASKYGCGPNAVTMVEGYYKGWSHETRDVLGEIGRIAGELGTVNQFTYSHVIGMRATKVGTTGGFLVEQLDKGNPLVIEYANHFATVIGYNYYRDLLRYTIHYGADEHESLAMVITYTDPWFKPLRLYSFAPEIKQSVPEPEFLLLGGILVLLPLAGRRFAHDRKNDSTRG